MEARERIAEVVRLGICDLCDHWASDTMSKTTREDIQHQVTNQILSLLSDGLELG